MNALTLRRTYLVAFAILVTAFVALYPSLGAMDYCDHGECPYVAHSSSSSASVGFAAMCLSAVLVASVAVVLFLATFYGRRIGIADLRPTQLYLSPDPPPPQLFFGK